MAETNEPFVDTPSERSEPHIPPFIRGGQGAYECLLARHRDEIPQPDTLKSDAVDSANRVESTPTPPSPPLIKGGSHTLASLAYDAHLESNRCNLWQTIRSTCEKLRTSRSHSTTSNSWLLRSALGVFLVAVCGQLWWPNSLTAQSKSGSRTQVGRQRESTNRTKGEVHQAEFNTGVRVNGGIQRVAQDNARDDVEPPARRPSQLLPNLPNVNVDQFVSPQGLSTSVNMWLVVTVLSLAPAILMMSTCFVRFIVVLSLLRQALGTQNLPPNQVLMGLSLILTFLVMAPVWNESYQQGIRPYTGAKSEASRPSMMTVFDNTVRPIRRFMSQQIDKAHNADAVWMFIEYQRPPENSLAAETWQEPETYDDVPLTALLPAYLLSELKTAFLIGFQIYLPFLIIDLVVASILMSTGMSMMPPTQVSLPFKLLLFVLIDGWTLTVGMLIESVRTVA